MSKFRTLIVGDFHSEAAALLKSQPHLDVHSQVSSYLEPHSLNGVDILLIRSGTKIHKKLLEKNTSLKLIITATSGFDHIDLHSVQNHSISCCYCPDAHVESVAQLTLQLILQLLRGGPAVASCIPQNKWRAPLLRGRTLEDLSLGIIGLGRIGQRVTTLAKAFGFHVQAYDPYIEENQFKKSGAERTSLIELLKTSDVISLHTPLTSKTKRTINHRTMGHINPEAFLINTARGALIDETELAVRMREGLLSGAALDVFDKEPLAKDSPLRELENVLLTPHIGAYTESAFRNGGFEAVEKVLAFVEKRSLKNTLPPTEAWAEDLIPD